jgi:hypothetical protein
VYRLADENLENALYIKSGLRAFAGVELKRDRCRTRQQS